jgi:hypothetical protein
MSSNQTPEPPTGTGNDSPAPSPEVCLETYPDGTPVFDPDARFTTDFSDLVVGRPEGVDLDTPLHMRPAKPVFQGGAFDPASFQDGAVVAASGKYPFVVDRELLVLALEAAASIAHKKKRPAIVRLVLLRSGIKVATVGERGDFVECGLPFPRGAKLDFGPQAAWQSA